VSDTVTTFPESSSNSPGAVLKRCREFHGLSLEDASETTKIGISYLKALEEDQIGEFANLTYLKGFLRIYAAYLGLNSDDMARMYDKLNGSTDKESNSDGTTSERTHPLRSMVSLQKLAMPAFLFLLILVVAAFFNRSPAPPVRPSQPAVVSSVAVPVIPVQAILSSAKTVAVKPAETEKAPAESESRPLVTNSEEKQLPSKHLEDDVKSFILKIKVTQNGALIAVVDGSAPQNYELTVGDIIEWKAEKSVSLDVSNAGAIDVELNGKPYKQMGTTGKPVYAEFDADGIKP
jgi:cytoskeletal protein RodZ